MINSILTINGSSRPNQHNAQLLRAMSKKYMRLDIQSCLDLSFLPLYVADQELLQTNQHVINFRGLVKDSDAVIISTPEYIHGVPAILKNALEWLTESGELYQKRVLALTYTPHQPRGLKCMTSLTESLSALNAHIVGTLQLYQNELTIDHDLNMIGAESVSLLDESINLLTHTN